MQDKLTFLLTCAAAAVLLMVALALAPTTITAPEAHEAVTTSAHSWLSDAFPTGQAGFARAADGGR